MAESKGQLTNVAVTEISTGENDVSAILKIGGIGSMIVSTGTFCCFSDSAIVSKLCWGNTQDDCLSIRFTKAVSEVGS